MVRGLPLIIAYDTSVLEYIWVSKSKKKIIMILLAVWFISFVLYTVHIYLLAFITCTVHRTVISIKHLVIASVGFFVLLASLPFGERNNFIRLS